MIPLNPAFPGTPGVIEWHSKWPKTEKVKAALLRLQQLGLSARYRPSLRPADQHIVNFELTMRVEYLSNYQPEELIEIGYLIAQLGNENFPEDVPPRDPQEPSCIFASGGDIHTLNANPTYWRFVVCLKAEG